MSLEVVRSVFEQMTSTRAWSACLLKIKKIKNSGTAYATRGIALKPDGALTEFVARLSEAYINPAKGMLQKYSAVCDYDGTTEAVKIYKLASTSQLIADEFTSLITAFSTPEMAGDPFEFAANAYSLKATLNIDGIDTQYSLFLCRIQYAYLKTDFCTTRDHFMRSRRRFLI